MVTKIGVVIVNFLCADAVDERARRLGQSDFAVVVVDNSGEYNGAGTVVRPGANVGFGEACNIGVRSFHGDAPLICLHNPDVDVTPATLRELGRRVIGLSSPGVVAPALRTRDSFRSAGYHRPSLLREAMVTSREVRTTGNVSSKTAMSLLVPEIPTGRELIEVPRRFGSGALLMLHYDAFEAVGGFDPRYPLYAEDLDLWYRVAKTGRTVGFAPDLVVDHARAGGSPTGRATRTLLRWVGVELFAALNQRTWPMLRRVHRSGLKRLDVAETSVIDAVRSSWDARLDPIETAAAVRAVFEAGAMDPGLPA